MKRLLCGIAVLPFLAAAAVAQPAASGMQPTQLSESQMDSVVAGFDLYIVETTNTARTIISLYQTPNTIRCGDCYINIYSPAFSVASDFRGY
jgi:hypothetical protein